MIPKSNKFPTRVQFLNFRARASQVVTPHLRLMTEMRDIKDPSAVAGPRLSVIVPIKVNKRAVFRNALKRIIYDAGSKALFRQNIDCIILFKPIALLKGKISEDLVLAELHSVIHSI